MTRFIFLFLLLGFVLGTVVEAQVTPIYDFNVTNGDPQCTLIETSPGVYYGGSLFLLFSITPEGAFSQLFNFDADENTPLGDGAAAGVIQGSDGSLYGTTYLGGNTGGGSIYRSDLAGNVSVFNTDVYESSPLVEGLDGNFYGITGSSTGGNYTFFRLTPTGVFTALYSLPNAFSAQPLILASDGNFYGATPGSSSIAGVVYRLTTAGEYTVIHTFSVNEGGTTSLLQASNGLLYGGYLGSNCNASDYGDGIFAVSLNGDYRVVEKLNGCEYGGSVHAGLVEGSDGNIYGADVAGALGVPRFAFQMTPDGSSFGFFGSFCYSCGNDPAAFGPAFMQGSDGNFYGTSVSGGYGEGTVFELNFNLAPPLPNVAAFQPKSGAPGTRVRIKGSHLVGASGVSFNGVAAKFVSRGNEWAIAVVPEGATSGPITVTTMNGSSTSKVSFDVQ